MSRHLIKEMEKLKRKIMGLSAIVEERLQKAVTALSGLDSEVAENVISADIEIDHMEVDIEEEALKLLALHQPVANDLRMIISILKMDSDLERIGDLAVNIAERARFLAAQGRMPSVPLDFATMARKAQVMLHHSLDALVNLDAVLASQVCSDDDEVDRMNQEMYDLIKDGIRKNPDEIDSLIHCLSISRHLERIADLATNIAEDVIYMVSGEIVRHKAEDYAEKHIDRN